MLAVGRRTGKQNVRRQKEGRTAGAKDEDDWRVMKRHAIDEEGLESLYNSCNARQLCAALLRAWPSRQTTMPRHIWADGITSPAEHGAGVFSWHGAAVPSKAFGMGDGLQAHTSNSLSSGAPALHLPGMGPATEVCCAPSAPLLNNA